MAPGRVRVGLSMQGTWIGTSHGVEPSQREPGVPDELQPATHVLGIGVMQWDFDALIGLHDRFGFEVVLPVRTNVIDASFLDEQGRELPGASSIHHRDETIAGIGDVTVGGRTMLVLPSDVPRWTLALRTGVSLPTGHIEPNPFALGERGRDHQHMFFGSGTIDPVLGFDTNVAFDRFGLVGWTASKLPLYSNRHGYRGSRVLVGGVGAISSFGLRRFSFLLQPEIYVEAPATWSGRPARNSGRVSLIATAGVFVMPAPAWQIHLLAKVPYATWAQGGQLRWPFVAMLGFSYVFDLEK